MSSSSSLAAARRRRAGGQQIVSAPPGRGPPPAQSTKQTTSSNSSNIPPNPLMILQQHHAKITMLDEQIQKLLSNQEFPPPIPHSNPPTNMEGESDKFLEENVPTQQKFDLNEVTELLLSRIESQLDLKVFYDNDQRLASEIENLNKIIIQQQSTLNHLNKLLYFIISNLKLDFNESQDQKLEEEENINLVIGDHLENQSEDSMITQQPTFPKSVKIDLNNNETTEYTPIEEEEDGTNYDPNIEYTEDGLPIPPVD